MYRLDHLPRMVGAAALWVLFAAASTHAQSATDSAGSTGSATRNAAPPASGASGTAGQAGSGTSGKLSKADAGMMRDMANVNVSEVAAAKIASDKSKNEHVTAYAKQMVDDHSASQKELTELAHGKGVTLPTEPDKKHQAAAKKLAGLSGEEFDRTYIKQNGIQDHRDARKLLMRVKDKATDADVKSAADKMLPTVEQHLKMAEELPVGKQGAKGSSGGSGTSGGGASGSQPK
jgi:putative membrane protein